MLLWYTYLFSRPIVVTAVDVTTFGWSIVYWKRKISHQKFSLCWKYLMEHEMIRFPILSWTQLKHPWKSPLEMATCFRWNRLVDDIERLAAFYISYSWKFHSINRDHMIREKKKRKMKQNMKTIINLKARDLGLGVDQIDIPSNPQYLFPISFSLSTTADTGFVRH